MDMFATYKDKLIIRVKASSKAIPNVLTVLPSYRVYCESSNGFIIPNLMNMYGIPFPLNQRTNELDYFGKKIYYVISTGSTETFERKSKRVQSTSLEATGVETKRRRSGSV
jgi:hypothetical protein